jgi:peptidoglycan/xylan/chitin deacetylase (PgdA/CDA1 family)
VHLTKVSLKEAKRQISQSKKILEQKLGKNVQYFCYPYGEYNQAVAKLVKASGYKAATNTKPGLVNARSNLFLLNRVRITGHLNHQGFVKKLLSD